MFIWWSKLGHCGGFTHSLLVWALQLGEGRMYGSRGSNMDWINEKFGCHCHVQHGPGGEWRDRPWLWAMRERPLAPAIRCFAAHSSLWLHGALDVIASITANISQPPFLTATALTNNNSYLWLHHWDLFIARCYHSPHPTLLFSIPHKMSDESWKFHELTCANAPSVHEDDA